MTKFKYREIIHQNDGKPCRYCEVTMHINPRHTTRRVGPTHERFPTRDHFIPKMLFKNYAGVKNIYMVCRTCNNDKANLAPEEWLTHLILTEDRRAPIFREIVKEHRRKYGDPAHKQVRPEPKLPSQPKPKIRKTIFHEDLRVLKQEDLIFTRKE